MRVIAQHIQAHQSLLLKTQPGFCPVSLSLSMVLLVAAAKILFEEQALTAGTNQNWQANKAVKSASFALCRLLALALSSGHFTN